MTVQDNIPQRMPDVRNVHVRTYFNGLLKFKIPTHVNFAKEF